MKKIILFVMAVAMMIPLLVGCGNPVDTNAAENIPTQTEPVDTFEGFDYLNVSGKFSNIQDKETGIQYIVCKFGGMAVRINADGTPCTSEEFNIDYIGVSGKFTVIEDTETGVQYIVCKFGGISPRLNADGTPYTFDRVDDMDYLGVSGAFAVLEDTETNAQYVVAKNGGIEAYINNN